MEFLHCHVLLFSNDCSHFGLEEPDFSLANDVRRDIDCCTEVWVLYEQFYEGFQEKAKEDWITFRFGFVSESCCIYSLL